MFKGSVLDVKGIDVAHITNKEAGTGCTFVLCREGAVGSVDVRGGAPGTRETDAILPGGTVPHVHGVMLSGGSAFGLAAANGAMDELEKHGIGFDSGYAKVPIIGGAVLYDLGYGRSDVRPDYQMGREAAALALTSPQTVEQGSVGAGTGATVGKFAGMQHSSKSGIGMASMKVGEATVAAIIAVNAVGNVYNHQTGELLKGMQMNGVYVDPFASLAGTNTTIGVVVTDAKLDKVQAKRLAMLAHDGYAMAIRPVHTMHDGDTAFAMATCKVEANVDAVFAAAAEVTARAICNAVAFA